MGGGSDSSGPLASDPDPLEPLASNPPPQAVSNIAPAARAESRISPRGDLVLCMGYSSLLCAVDASM
jgi:hypothetical protein